VVLIHGQDQRAFDLESLVLLHQDCVHRLQARFGPCHCILSGDALTENSGTGRFGKVKAALCEPPLELFHLIPEAFVQPRRRRQIVGQQYNNFCHLVLLWPQGPLPKLPKYGRVFFRTLAVGRRRKDYD
jgi:hypothetical protein